MAWLFFGMIGFVILILILLSRLYVSFKLLYSDQAQYISVSVSLFRIRIFKRKVPLSAETISSGPAFGNYSPSIRELLASFKPIQQTMMATLKKVTLHRFNWVTKGGTGDAASTGITAGGIWTVKGMAAGLIGNMLQLKCHPVVQVKPDYQKMYFYSTMDCMVSVQIAQAIHIIFKIMRLLFSIKPEKAVSAS